MARDAKLVLRVPEAIKDEFQKVASEMGMTMSALGAYCIGQYLRQERNKVQVQNKVFDTVLPMLKDQMNVDLEDPRVVKAMTDFFTKLGQQQDISKL